MNKDVDIVMKYFLITGMAKSGTTWVQRICRAHPEMHCRTEDQFTKFWGRVESLTKDYNDLIELRDGERDRQGVEAFTKNDATHLFYAMVRMALDKAPEALVWSGIKDLTLSAKGFLRFIPDARVINVIRDPRDVAISAIAHARRIGEDTGPAITGIGDRTVSDSCTYWVKQLRLIDRARTEHPGKTHDIRYEDLLTNFEPTLKRLLEFFGVEASSATIEALRRETDFKRLSGGRSPGETDSASYFRKGVAGDWRATLSRDQIALAASICGDDLLARGYELK